MNKCTEFSADLNTFRYINEYTFVFVTVSQTYGFSKKISHWSFRSPEGMKRLQKKFQANRREKVMEFRFRNTSSGGMIHFFCILKIYSLLFDSITL